MISRGTRRERTGEWIDGIGRLEEPFTPEVEACSRPTATCSPRFGPAMASRPIRARRHRPRIPAAAGSRRLRRAPSRGPTPPGRALQQRHNIKVMHLDGWTALHAAIPPKEKRGLVLIDPPYEEPDELDRLGSAILRRCENGRPGLHGLVSDQGGRAVDAVAARLNRESPRPGLRLELLVDDPRDPTVSTAAACSSSTRPGPCARRRSFCCRPWRNACPGRATPRSDASPSGRPLEPVPARLPLMGPARLLRVPIAARHRFGHEGIPPSVGIHQC